MESEKIIGKGTMSQCNKLINTSSSEKIFIYIELLNTLSWKDNEKGNYEDILFIDDINNDTTANKITIKTSDCDNDIEIQYKAEDKEKWDSFYDKCYQIVEKNKSELFLRKKIFDLLNENREKPITYTQFIYLLNDKKDNVDTVNNNTKLNMKENRVGKGSQVEVIWSDEYKTLYGKEPDYTKDEIEYFTLNYKIPKWKSIFSPSYLEEWRKNVVADKVVKNDTDDVIKDTKKVENDDTVDVIKDTKKVENDDTVDVIKDTKKVENDDTVAVIKDTKKVENDTVDSVKDAETTNMEEEEEDFEIINKDDLKNPTTTISYTPFGFEIIVDFTKYITNK
jgi:hypothetical protein